MRRMNQIIHKNSIRNELRGVELHCDYCNNENPLWYVIIPDAIFPYGMFCDDCLARHWK